MTSANEPSERGFIRQHGFAVVTEQERTLSLLRARCALERAIAFAARLLRGLARLLGACLLGGDELLCRPLRLLGERARIDRGPLGALAGGSLSGQCLTRVALRAPRRIELALARG